MLFSQDPKLPLVLPTGLQPVRPTILCFLGFLATACLNRLPQVSVIAVTRHHDLIPSTRAAELLGLRPRSLDVARATGALSLAVAATFGGKNYYLYSDVIELQKARSPRVYIAGKICRGDWRNSVVPGLHGRFLSGDCLQDVLEVEDTTDPTRGFSNPSPMRCPGFIYTGPFFIRDDHGCAHGPASHGAYNRHLSDATFREVAHANALRGIRQASAVFAWLGGDDALTAYGTVTEIGYARALGTPVFIGTDRDLDPELWFVVEGLPQIRCSTPQAAFDQFLTDLTY